jgi:hypothetical protein
MCTDAGADLSTYVNEYTGYDMVQNAANVGQFEAVVKLVEAGASWRLPKGHPCVGANGLVFYVPKILSVQKQMKVRPVQIWMRGNAWNVRTAFIHVALLANTTWESSSCFRRCRRALMLWLDG